MTAAIAHHLPQRLPMSPINSNTRRLSARLQKKETSQVQFDHADATNEGAKSSSSAGSKKRKVQYEEEEDGFAFSRVKKSKQVANSKTQTTVLPVQDDTKSRMSTREKSTATPAKAEVDPKKRRQRMSFSTPKARLEPTQRRSKRLSNEATDRTASPPLNPDHKIVREKRKSETAPKQSQSSTKLRVDAQTTLPTSSTTLTAVNHASNDPAATQIALPMSDTPVIRRNKAMREGRGSRGERRSSLGLRGRRASSLIGTGNSNALPHTEVAISDFYKHIESEQLETKRMRQLLTWCATRSMHAKPQGSEFDDTHTIMSARAIEEELLKELSNRPDLSDWFAREDAPVLVAELPQRPNPKNLQNTNKIAELEERIQRLRVEKDALEALLQPPVIVTLSQPTKRAETLVSGIDTSLLDEGDITALSLLESSSAYSTHLADRVNRITSSLGPTVDTFADGVHKVAQYRTAADNVASRVLSICAAQLAYRESEGRRKALHSGEDRDPMQDMNSVLRGLSRVDR